VFSVLNDRPVKQKVKNTNLTVKAKYQTEIKDIQAEQLNITLLLIFITCHVQLT